MTVIETTAPAPLGPPTPSGRGREYVDRMVFSVLIIAALVMAIWPVAATFNNNYKAFQFAQTAVSRGDSLPPADSAAMLEAARAYNNDLPQTALNDPIFGAGDPLSSPAYEEYLALLGGGKVPMATLRIPDIGVTLPVFHGTSDSVLARGAGHMFGTGLPVGGEGVNSALAAHRGLPQMTAFDNLPDMQVGDQFFIDVHGETLAYEVSKIATVLPDDLDGVQPVAGADLVTLITCTPYGVNSHRLLVTGERIDLADADPEIAAAGPSFDWSIQDWMWPRVITSALCLLLLLILATRWTVKDVRLFVASRKAPQIAPVRTEQLS